MQTTKKTLILSSPFGMVGMATFTVCGNSVRTEISLPKKDGYKIVILGDKRYEFDMVLARSYFTLPMQDADKIAVEVYEQGVLFCKGGEGEKREEFQASQANESEERESEIEEAITYMDDAVATENYYPSSVKVVSVDGKNEAVLLSRKLNDYIENSSEGLFVCKIRKEEKQEQKEEVRRVKTGSVFMKKPFDYDEVASTVFPALDTSFSRRAYYFEQVKDKIDALFSVGVRDKNLEAHMPDSKWVRIEYSHSRFYVVGLIGGSGDIPDYICYGLPATYSSVPPSSLGRDARWTPLDVKKPQGEGYWLLFQSAKSGETIRSE